MQKGKVVVGVGLLALVALAGCQSVEEQIGKKIAESAIGQAVGGDVKIDEKSGNMVIKTKDGEANVGGGDTRPSTVPSDLPNLPNAKNFSWLGNQESGIFNYEIEAADFKATCQSAYAMVGQAGWTDKKSAFNFDSEDSVMKTMVKEGRTLTLICGKSEGGLSTISMSYGKDTSTADANESSNTETDTSSESTDTSTEPVAE